jgi:hypothetical protein
VMAEFTATVLLVTALVLDHYRPQPGPVVATTGGPARSNGPGQRVWDEGDGPAAATG